MKKILLVLLVFFAILFVFTFRFGGQPGNISPNILYLTHPVTSFSGMVEKIDGNFVTVNQVIYPTPSIIKNPPSTPAPVKLSYRIRIDQNTIINRSPINVPYLFNTLTPTPTPKLTIKDIIADRSITLSTNADLRLVADDKLTATTVDLPALVIFITGKITNIQGDLLTVRALMPSALQDITFAPPPKETDFQVKVNENTEISRKTSFPEKMSLSDLKINTIVTIYTIEDVILTQNLTALKIEPSD